LNEDFHHQVVEFDCRNQRPNWNYIDYMVIGQHESFMKSMHPRTIQYHLIPAKHASLQPITPISLSSSPIIDIPKSYTPKSILFAKFATAMFSRVFKPENRSTTDTCINIVDDNDSGDRAASTKRIKLESKISDRYEWIVCLSSQ